MYKEYVMTSTSSFIPPRYSSCAGKEYDAVLLHSTLVRGVNKTTFARNDCTWSVTIFCNPLDSVEPEIINNYNSNHNSVCIIITCTLLMSV